MRVSSPRRHESRQMGSSSFFVGRIANPSYAIRSHLMSAGYSGTPLIKKLGIKSGFRIFVENAPESYQQLLATDAPVSGCDDVVFVTKLEADLDMIHLFTDQARELAAKLKRYRRQIKPDGMLWV